MVAERISFVPGGAGKLRVSDGGQGGVPVVLVHGLGSELETWRPVLDRLRASRRVVAYDQRGHGKSDPATEYTIADMAADLDQVVSQLGFERIWLVGHSFSGSVVSAYAAEHRGRVAGVVYLDAVGDASRLPEVKEYFRRHDAGMTANRLQAAYSEMLGSLATPATRSAVLGSSGRMDLAAFAALRRELGTFDGLAAARKYEGPRFAIEAEGEQNPVRASQLPGTKRIGIPGVSHWLMLDDPEATARALEEVLG
ncbi:MAG TPA: alpha/beta hydrolase [Myxococcales bacterium]|nr:alpha/beta hydrolase [Myxococcales bacterium]